jgi:pimeloyl-ACP methyl ester carboxylesterase
MKRPLPQGETSLAAAPGRRHLIRGMAIFILVHGAMHGGWCWRKLVPLLESQGHRVFAPDLPGMGEDPTPLSQVTMGTWTQFIARRSREAGGPVILVGHSRGGTVISEAAELAPEAMLGLVYLAALLLPSGRTAFEATVAEDARKAADPVGNAAEPGKEGSQSLRIEPETARALFYNRASAEDAVWASGQLCPEPLAPNTVPLTVTRERWGRLPRAYIECLDDRALPIALQRSMQAAFPCDPVVTMDSDHSPFLCAPRALAAHLEDIAAGFAAR